MTKSLSILMAQINPVVGAITNNTQKIIDIIQWHKEKHQVIVFPELAITGYPPEDLIYRKHFFLQIEEALQNILLCTNNCHIIVGHPWIENNERYNAVSILANGSLVARYYKQHLPNYGVFDEKRYFTPGPAESCVFMLNHYRIGVCICEDIWLQGPMDHLIADGIDLAICINASPFEINKQECRETLLQTYAKRGIAVIYVNQVGGQDELVFDGQSFALNSRGEICARAPAFCENLLPVILKNNDLYSNITPLLDKCPLIYQALVCSLRDYVTKNNFPGVLLGLSGGIDSALTLCIAVDALDASRVHAVMMPSRYTATMSIEDAKHQADLMGVSYSVLPIEPTFESLLTTLSPSFTNYATDTTEENLQARIRGVLLMALSNKTGNMLLTTSNKSETAVGYSTLYGDMAGGFAVLKDVLKTQVYALAHYRNSLSALIPDRVLTRPPSAELASNQTDQDSLPAYPILDDIITQYMENNASAAEIARSGYARQDIEKVIKLIKRNEYKRRQAAPGVKISPRAFGRDWRYPITSGFFDEEAACKKQPKR